MLLMALHKHEKETKKENDNLPAVSETVSKRAEVKSEAAFACPKMCNPSWDEEALSLSWQAGGVLRLLQSQGRPSTNLTRKWVSTSTVAHGNLGGWANMSVHDGVSRAG